MTVVWEPSMGTSPMLQTLVTDQCNIIKRLFSLLGPSDKSTNLQVLVKDSNNNKKLDDGRLLPTVTDERQTQPFVREGAPERQDSKFQTELISGHKFHSGLDTKTYWLTDHQS
jgi:hypothetical protein